MADLGFRTWKIGGALALCACVQHLAATSCGVPPPCDMLHPQTVTFVGTVVEAGSGPNTIMTVDEPFVGLPPNVKEVTVASQETWLQKGHQYLFDLYRGSDGAVLFPALCGDTAEVGDPRIAAKLEYLRNRARGNVTTSLSVYVSDSYKSLAGADVSIEGPDQLLKGITDSDGKFTFSDVKPSRYSVKAEKEHYRLDPEELQETSVDVIFGACPSAHAGLKSDTQLAGVVHNFRGDPVPSLELELVVAPKSPQEELTFRGIRETETRADGTFAFESVSPGQYLLGVNILNLNTSSLPRTFYPDVRDKLTAIPVEVALAKSIDNLAFTLPDYGPEREITLCVVDTDGKPVASTTILSDPVEGIETARLGDKLFTDSSGCIHTHGYASIEYVVNAMFTPNPRPSDFRELAHQMRSSDRLTIPAGDETPVTRVLVLHPSSSAAASGAGQGPAR